MNDQEIHTDLPMGSPILAYGTATSRTSPKRTILAIIAGIFVVCVIGVFSFLQTSLQMPSHIVVLAAIRANTTLPNGAPTLWRDAAQHTSSPLLIGLTETDGTLRPFALAFGDSMPEGSKQREGLFMLISSSTVSSTDTWKLAQVIGLLAKTTVAPAYLRVDAHAIDPSYDGVIDGPIESDGTWKTGFFLPKASPPAIPDTNFSIDLRAFPDAWPPIEHALQQNGFEFDTTDVPATFGWNRITATSPSVIHLRYAAGPSTSTIQAFSAASGIYSTSSYTLHDNVVTEGLNLPTRELELTGNSHELVYGDSSTTEVHTAIDPCSSGGSTVLTLRKLFLATIIQQAKLTDFLPLEDIVASENDGRLEICVR